MTLSDPQPGFQDHCILTSWISQKRCIWGTKLLNQQPTVSSYLYRVTVGVRSALELFLSLARGLGMHFQTFSGILRAAVTVSARHSRHSIRWTLTACSALEADAAMRYRNLRLTLTLTLKNANRKPNAIYRMVPLSMTLSDLWPQFQGHDIFRHWISRKRHDRHHHLVACSKSIAVSTMRR